MKWSVEEDNVLESMYRDGYSNKEISEHLSNRTATAVSVRLSSRGLTDREIMAARGNENLTGLRFGKLTVREQNGIGSNGSRLWSCDCDCGCTITVAAYLLKRNNVRSCGCLKKRENNSAWKGYKEIGNSFWGGYERGAKSRNIEYNITIEEGWQLFIEQNRRCALTGQEIGFVGQDGRSRHGTASLDRIDPHKGYYKENCMWVHKDINRLKNNYTLEHFIKMCTLVADYRKQ